MSDQAARSRREQRVVRTWLAVWDFAGRVPAPVAWTLGRLGGLVFYLSDGRRRANLRANLRQVLGPDVGERELERVVRRGFGTYARYWMEAFRLERLSAADVLERFTFVGVEHIEAGVASGKGVICAVPHIGNWDVGGSWLAARGWRALAVAERVRPVELFERFRTYREQIGLEIVPLDEGSKALATLARALRAGAVVALVSDRDLTRNGVPVTMFGRQTTLPAGPASLALRTGSMLLPAAVYQTRPGHWVCVTHGPIEVVPSGDARADAQALTRRLAVAFERLIADAPDQWHVLVPFWTGPPAGADEPASGQEVPAT